MKEEKNKVNVLEKSGEHKKVKVFLAILAVIFLIVVSFIIYEVATVNNTYYIGEKDLQIPIFVYHNVVKDESEIEYDYMQVTAKKIESQIAGLMKLGYKPISYQDLKDYKEGKKALSKWSFLITFDDGYSGVYDYAFELAKKYNIPMTTFLIDDVVGSEGYYNWQQAKEMHDSGLMGVYSHGLTHIKYDEENTEKLIDDTKNAYISLTTNLEDENLLKVFTYPYGLNRKEERDALYELGYTQNLTDNMVNQSDKLDFSGLHRCYPLDDSVFKIILKIQYRCLKYGA